MKYIQFTKKENEVMDILWKHDIAMSANDIKLASKDLSINTIQQTLQKIIGDQIYQSSRNWTEQEGNHKII